jgi:NADPH2:quinone reductase
VQAIRQYEFGGPDTLRYEDVPDPEPFPDQVRIRVEVCGVHLVDTTLRRGEPTGPPLPALPYTPGREVAGVVDRAADASWLGKRVVAHLGAASGGYASMAVAPVAALHELPDSLSAAAAVALIGTGRTALAVLDLAQLTPSDVVLVPGASGGLGVLLTQAARAAGATTVGLAGGPGKTKHVQADVVIDYTAPDWADQVPDGVTVLLDGVGGAVGRTAFEKVATGGRVVLFGWASGAPFELSVWDLYRQGLTVSCGIGPRIAQRPGGLRAWETSALALGAAGTWTPLVGPPYPLADAAAAHRAIESRTTIGKTILLP